MRGRSTGGSSVATEVKLNLNTVVWKRILVQALTPTDAVVSITREGSGRGDQAALASRTLGGSAMRAALNSGPMVPVAGGGRGNAPPPLRGVVPPGRTKARHNTPPPP